MVMLQDYCGRTPLMIACMTGNEVAVRRLVTQPEIDLYCQDDQGSGQITGFVYLKHILIGRNLDFYARKNKRIYLLLENARRNPSEIQQLNRVKTILNKEVEAEKEGRIVNQQLMEFNNDPIKSKKKFQIDDLPDYVLEEAGCVKKSKKKEKSVMESYKAEKVRGDILQWNEGSNALQAEKKEKISKFLIFQLFSA